MTTEAVLLFTLTLAIAATGDTGAPWVDSALVDTAVVDPAPPAAYTRPVGYWPLDEADSVVVELANDREGLLFGTTDADGPAGPAQAFDGGAWAELGTHLDKMTTGDDARFSLGLWLYPEGGPGVLWSKASHLISSLTGGVCRRRREIFHFQHVGVTHIFCSTGNPDRIRFQTFCNFRPRYQYRTSVISNETTM